MMKLALCVGTVVMSASVAFAQGGAAPPPKDAPAPKAAPPPKAAAMEVPKPGKEVDALKPMVKNWTCKGSGTFPGPTPITINYTSRVTSKWDLNGFWADWRYDRAKTKEVPGLTGEGEWGYDLANKKYLMQGVDNWGGWINLTSAGPSGDTFAFDGDIQLNGQKMPAKMTFTTDPKAKKLHFTIETGGVKLLDDECK